jgi:integrase/recombinase XerD
MSRFDEPQFEPVLDRLRAHIRTEQYGICAKFSYPYAARCFLRYLERRGGALESVRPADLERYLKSLRRKGRRGPFPKQYRRMHRAAIKMLLRVVRGSWPPEVLPKGHELAARKIISAFDEWMRDLRGLAMSSRRHRRAEMAKLLEWLRHLNKAVGSVTIDDLDLYVSERATTLRRNSTAEVVSTLRGVLRYLHERGLLRRDFAPLLKGPTIYALEGIPSTIAPEDVRRALAALKEDRSPTGLRDYAIWMLLTTYGLRGAEIKALQLSDIDWRGERLRIRHSKTGAYSELPLLRKPANALLDYLRHGRPATSERTVFLRAQAPYRPFAYSTPLHGVVSRRLAAVGVVPAGKHGTHALRHARAVSLLRGGVPLKVIGDVLGHRSQQSTAPYLKLAIDDLRSVALDLPVRAAP